MSQYLYETNIRHLEIRNLIFAHNIKNQENLYIFFHGNDIDNYKEKNHINLLEDYILINNNEGQFAWYLE